ncbi:MAG: filamentous hemagglutinin N-terminal domain-containing protein, partial [Planctomycetes bacterium]|nr:filamentous hemagglutinin N-terminal domain-containing protein [Planctomycetota bacterium]
MKTNITRRPSLVKQFVCLVAVSIIALHPLPQLALADPEGEQVVQGQVNFNRDGNLTVITASNNSIINYQGFGIQTQETVQFVQPNELARVLNRVLGPDPSVISGTLLANGIVYITNPAGVYFRNGAIVDVGGIYAAAGTITNQNFLNNINHFTNLTGSVVNQGTINGEIVSLLGKIAANHGSIVGDNSIVVIAAGDDILIGERGGHIMVRITNGASAVASDAPAVENTGTISAGRGKVALGAGDMVSLAIRNTGTVRAGEIALEAGGQARVEVSGTLDAANNSPGGTGGAITVLGDRVAIVDATIDASGDAGGGTVLIGGDFQGGGELPTASRTYVSTDSTITADAITEGDGGKLIVWADELTGFFGSLSARGGANSGDGGFAEISGAQSLISRGTVDLSAQNGSTGTVLYDPENIVITGSVGGDLDGDDSDGAVGTLNDGGADGIIVYADLPDAFVIYESEIEGTGASINLQATNSISVSGDFNLDDVAITAGNSLTMTTSNALGEGSGGIDLTSSLDGTALEFKTTDTGTTGTITLTAGADGGDIGTANIIVGKLTTETGAIAITSEGAVTINNVIATTSGNVTLDSGAAVSGTGSIAAALLTIDAATGVDVTTTVTTLDIDNTTFGSIDVDETNDVDI